MTCSRRAGGMVAMMDRFSTYFGLKLSVLDNRLKQMECRFVKLQKCRLYM